MHTGWDDTRRFAGSEAGGLGSLAGSREGLLADPLAPQPSWPNSSAFLAASFSFSLSYHSLLSLPLAATRNGGVAFLLLHSALLAVLGWPLLTLEMFLGQFSGQAVPALFHRLCPLLAGLGLAVSLLAATRAVLSFTLLARLGRALYLAFSEQEDPGPAAQPAPQFLLAGLAQLDTELAAVLAGAALLLLLAVLAGPGRAGQLAAPAAFLLVVTLSVRSCLAPGGSQSVATLLSPDWAALARPATWLEAVCQVTIYTFYT